MSIETAILAAAALMLYALFVVTIVTMDSTTSSVPPAPQPEIRTTPRIREATWSDGTRVDQVWGELPRLVRGDYRVAWETMRDWSSRSTWEMWA